MMARYARVACAVGMIAVLAAFAFGGVYAYSEWCVRRTRHAPLDAGVRLPASTDDREARRQSILIGCWEGCHGRTGEGLTMTLPGGQRLTAPNLSQVLPDYDDAHLLRLLRFGVRRDGTTALMMPADTFYPMGDAHIGLIVDFLRRQPPTEGPPRERNLTLRTRLDIVRGRFPLSADEVDPHGMRWGEQPRTSAFDRGRYIAATVCAECHAPDFEGDAWDGGPALAVVAGYDFARFAHLLRTGEPVGGRRLGDMAEVARAAFVHFSDDEVCALYVFLRERIGLTHDDVAGACVADADHAGTRDH